MRRPDPIARHRAYLAREIARLTAEWVACKDPAARDEIEAELDVVDDALACLDMCFGG